MSEASEHAAGSGMRVYYAILAVIAVYLVSLVMGLPQRATALIVGGHGEQHAGDHPEEHAGAEEHPAGGPHAAPGEQAEHAADGEHGVITAPPVWTVIPFLLLLGAIAVLPLIPFTEHWWESNLHRLQLAAALGLLTLGYFGFLHQAPIEGHFPTHHVVAPAEGGFNTGIVTTVLDNAILQEYIPFIVLLFSLYTISGGIRIEGDLQANPLTNAIFMAAGGLLASFIGTTGAAMLLIRPLLETNSERKHVAHTVVFFIFVVCNCGGCLLPIGDPPLFLGYLQGVDFSGR